MGVAGSTDAGRAREFFATYTQGVTGDDLRRLLTRDTRDAYRYFARGIDTSEIDRLPFHRRVLARSRLFLLAFSLRLTPARRALLGLSLAGAVIGLIELFDGFVLVRLPVAGPFVPVNVPMPVWTGGAMWLLLAFAGALLLVLLEVADRVSLKSDLNIAREIQLAMLPQGTYRAAGLEAHGRTRPANTVGGDFYDLQPLGDGRLGIAVGDVSGKGSPAALLMALLLAVLHTLLDEHLEPARLVERLNAHVARHAPGSRFITFFFGAYDPVTGRLTYVNAGHPPAIVRRRAGGYDRLREGGVALGLFDGSRYETGMTEMAPGDLLVLVSDGVTEAERPDGEPFDEIGITRLLDAHADANPEQLGDLLFEAVARHADATRFADDLTVLALRRTG